MLLREWNQDEAIAIAKEEAREDVEEEILDIIEKGYTTADIKNHLCKQEPVR